MKISDDVVDSYKEKYGKVVKFHLKEIDQDVLFRPLNFGEYLNLGTKVKVMSSYNGRAEYEFEPTILPYIIKNTLLYPKDIDQSALLEKPGIMITIATYVMRITLFEDDELLVKTYVDKLKEIGSTAMGELLVFLVSSFGIDGYIKTKNMQLNEIMDLIILGELTTQRIGMFSEVIGRPDILPRDRRGRVSIKALMQEDNNEEQYKQQPKTEPRQHPVQSQVPPQSNKSTKSFIEDLNGNKTTYDPLEDEQASAYIKSLDSKSAFDAQMKLALEQSKKALARQIEIDKRSGKRHESHIKTGSKIDDLFPGLSEQFKKTLPE